MNEPKFKKCIAKKIAKRTKLSGLRAFKCLSESSCDKKIIVRDEGNFCLDAADDLSITSKK